MMPAALAGLAGGLAILWSMRRAGLLAERSGIAVLVAAIAFFWPVFAVQADAGLAVIALHGAVFVGFAALAVLGFRHGCGILAAALLAHGLFDLGAGLVGHPGPDWWPAFCAALDVAVGVGLLVLVRRGDVA